MSDCKTNGHIYRQFSTTCVMCGDEGTNFEKCSPPCEYYDTGTCRCAQMEGPVPDSTAQNGSQHDLYAAREVEDRDLTIGHLRARIAQLEADLKVAQNYEDQHYKRCQQLEAALRDTLPWLRDARLNMTPAAEIWDRVHELLDSPVETMGEHPGGGPCIHVWALTNRSAVENGKCELCGNTVKTEGK